MIQASEMKEGLIVCDPEFNRNPSRQFFRLETPHRGGEGPWPATHCATGVPAEFKSDDLKRLVPIGGRIFCEVDFTALIGRRVRLHLHFGSQATGTIQEVRGDDIEIDGETITVPSRIVIQSEEYKINQIKSIERLEAP